MFWLQFKADHDGAVTRKPNSRCTYANREYQDCQAVFLVLDCYFGVLKG
jgi:hypothetical protein